MGTKLHDEIREIIDTDEPHMTPAIRYGWYGYLSALYNYGHITLDEYEGLSAILQIVGDEKKDIYDALSGGILERE